MRSGVKLALIANLRTRSQTYKKRKRGLKKKLEELTVLCNVKACAIINSPYEPTPDVWPSPEGVEEVASRLMEMPIADRFKKAVDQETYLQQRIKKVEEKVKMVHRANRESLLRQFMFNFLEGKMNVRQCDPRDLQDLKSYMVQYINQINIRIKKLTEGGESSFSALPLFPATSAYSDPPVALDGDLPIAADPTTIGFYDQAKQEPVQYQAPVNSTDQIQHGIYDMNLNHNLSENWNQYPYQQESSLNVMVEPPQQMGYVGEHPQNPFMEGYYNYHQAPTADLAPTTGLMPSITTHAPAPFAGVYVPYNNSTL